MARKDLIIVIAGDNSDLLNKLKQVRSEFGQLGKDLSMIGKTLTTGLTVPIIAGLGAAVKVAGDFEEQMSDVGAKAQATGEEFEKLKALAIELGAKTSFSAKQAAEGMSELAQAGFSTQEIMAAMPGLLNLAAAGSLELSEAAAITAAAVRGFGLEAAESARVADVLAKAAITSQADVTSLGEALKFVAPVAKSLGISLEETVAMIGKLADVGLDATMAGRSLRSAMLTLLDPSKEAMEVFERLNVAWQNADGSARPFLDVMKDLATAQASATDMAKIFAKETVTAAIVLRDNVDTLGAYTESLKEVGVAERVAEEKLNNFKGSLEQLMGSLETLAITIAQAGILGWLRDIADKATEVANELSKTNPELLKFGTGFALLTAAIGPALFAIGQMSLGVKALMALGGPLGTMLGTLAKMALALGPGGAIAAGVAALAASLLLVKQRVSEFDASLKEINEIKRLTEDLNALGMSIQRVSGESWEEFAARVRETASALDDKLTPATQTWQQRWDAANKVLENGKELLKRTQIAAQGLKTEMKQGAIEIALTAKDMQLLADAGIKVEKAVEKIAPAVGDIEKATEKAKKKAEELHKAFLDTFDGVQKITLENLRVAIEEAKKNVIALKDAAGDVPPIIAAAVSEADQLAMKAVAAANATEKIKSPLEAARDAAKALGITIKSDITAGMEEAAAAVKAVELAYAQGLATAQDVAAAKIAAQDKVNELLGVEAKKVTDLDRLWKGLDGAVRTFGNAVVDVFMGTAELGEAFMAMLEEIARTILDTIVQGAIDVLKESIIQNIAAVDLLSAAWKKFFGVVGVEAAGGAAGAAGGAAGGAGGAAGGGLAGLAGVVNMITGIANLIVGIFQSFQFAAMNKTLDLIEREVRESKIHLGFILEAMHTYMGENQWQRHEAIKEFWITHLTKMDELLEAVKEIRIVAVAPPTTPTPGSGPTTPFNPSAPLLDLGEVTRMFFVDLFRNSVESIREALGAILERLDEIDLNTFRNWIGPELEKQSGILTAIYLQLSAMGGGTPTGEYIPNATLGGGAVAAPMSFVFNGSMRQGEVLERVQREMEAAGIPH